MKRLKIVSIVVFLLAVVLFGGYTFKEKVAKDQTGPVISMDSDRIEVSVGDDTEALLRGVTASDAHDGDTTDSVYVESLGPVNGEGERVVRYVAFDTDGHVTHAIRTMCYTDYTEPVFRITEPLSFPVNTESLLGAVTAEDCIDGDISDRIQVIFEDDISLAQAGNYAGVLRVTNSAGGSAELPVTFEIYNASENYRLPKLSLTRYLIYLNKGEKFNAAENLSAVEINGIAYSVVAADGTYGTAEDTAAAGTHTIDQSRITITGDVDTNTAGCYEVSYSLSDAVYGTGTGTVRAYVVVTEGGTR